MNSLAALVFITALSSAQDPVTPMLSPEEVAFENRFNELSKAGVTLDHLPTQDSPWGNPNPDAEPELQQFAFMVGRSHCIQPLTGINPNSPDQILKNDLVWLAYYALDGRAIRDEFYSLASNG